VTLGRLLAGAAPLTLLKLGIVAMAIIDSILVFGNQLQAPNATLIAAVPAHGLPQLQSASFIHAGLGYGDFFAAGVLGGVLAAEGRPQLAAASACSSRRWPGTRCSSSTTRCRRPCRSRSCSS
jgi:hypothetical protein